MVCLQAYCPVACRATKTCFRVTCIDQSSLQYQHVMSPSLNVLSDKFASIFAGLELPPPQALSAVPL